MDKMMSKTYYFSDITAIIQAPALTSKTLSMQTVPN